MPNQSRNPLEDLISPVQAPAKSKQRGVVHKTTKEETDAEALDPYSLGYEQAALAVAAWSQGQAFSPPACPLSSSMAVKLYRRGFNERVKLYMTGTLRKHGLTAEAWKTVKDVETRLL